MMITETIFLGILLGFIYHELVGLTPGGIIVPGYIALYFIKPMILVTTFVSIIITLLVLKGLSHLIIIYGRRAFLAAVVIGFLLKWLMETIILTMDWMNYDLEVIGYIIPGLIANEMRKQGIWETLLSLILVSAIVHFVIRLQNYLFT